MDFTALQRRQLLLVLYIGFISLGLPDTILGVAWPQMQLTFGVPLETAGLLVGLTTIVSFVASLSTGLVLKRISTGMILTVCALTTAFAMLGYGLAPSIYAIAFATLFFGIGQGAVDTAVNAFMTRHYSARQMNWIHGCWGMGATGGPMVFTAIFALGMPWRAGYISVFLIQLCFGLFFMSRLKIWPNEKTANSVAQEAQQTNNTTGKKRFISPAAGVVFYMLYPGVDSVIGLWGASYLITELGSSLATAGAAITMYWGCQMTGRFLIGIVSNRFSGAAIIRGGLSMALIGIAIIFATATPVAFIAALAFIGLGLAPLYPTMMHETPKRAGTANLERITGFQVGANMAGCIVIPTAVGFLVKQPTMSMAIIPWVLLIFAAFIITAHEISVRCR
ncbi:MAG: MFS transporter [Deferribacteraceae bacterium]|jgi:fucose permease|nr:MFS transporter [Deferribacteraceae bacterium]